MSNETINANTDNLMAKNIIRTICPKLSDLLLCLDRYSNSTEICLQQNEIKAKNAVMRIYSKSLTRVCNNNGEPIINLLSEDSMKCINEEKLSNVDTCLETKMNLHQLTDSNSLTNATATYCPQIIEIENCLIDNLNDCDSKAPTSFIRSIFDVIFNESPCKRNS